MKTNIHPMERVLRVALGLFLVSLVFWGPAEAWFWLGLIPIATGFAGWCPPYHLLKINTNRR